MATLKQCMSVLVSLLLIAACRSDSFEPSESILIQILGSSFTGVVRLLEEANLLSDLESEEHFSQGVTILAPSDHYLSDVVSPALLAFLEQPNNVALLRKVLLHHMVKGRIGAQAWYPGGQVKTLAGTEVWLTVEGSELKVDGATVEELGALEAEDGVVHAINGLMLPADVEQAAQVYLSEATSFPADRRESLEFEHLVVEPLVSFDSQAAAPSPSALTPAEDVALLEAALKAAGQYTIVLSLLISHPAVVTEIETILAEGNGITVFAPTDSALTDSGIDPSTVTDSLLEYHVLVGSFSSAQLGSGSTGRRRLLSTYTTLSGQTVDVTKNATGLYVNGIYVSQPNLLPPTSGNTGIAALGINGVLNPATAPPASPPPPPTSTATSPPPPPPPSSAGVRLDSTLWVVMAFGATVGAVLLF